ncbi:MAG: DMT family transporter [Bosea sp. (in: a-proteobacteria)]
MSWEREGGREQGDGFDAERSDDAISVREACEPPPEPPNAAPILTPIVTPIVLAQPPDRDGVIARLRRRLALGWRGASPNLRGSIYMFSAMLVYAVMVGGIKHVGGAIPLVQILLIRQIIMSLVIVAIAGAALPALLRTTRPGLQVLRGVVTLISMLFGFTAIIMIPLAQATAIGFSQVLFVTIAAVLVLKETVDARRWAATAIGFVGVLIMLNPFGEGLNIYALMAVGGALFSAAITISVRMLAATERTETILLWQGGVLILALAVPTWLFWVAPTTEQWLWLVVLSLFGTAGQWLITRAYQVGEAAALAPLDFSRLIISSFTGFVFFAEIPALATWIGAAIVIGATLYTIRKNARQRPEAPG